MSSSLDKLKQKLANLDKSISELASFSKARNDSLVDLLNAEKYKNNKALGKIDALLVKINKEDYGDS